MKFRNIITEQLSIALGSLILAAGINVFLVPNKISAGGISSIATVLLYVFHIKMSVTNLFFNAVLFVLGYKYLGKYAIVKTISGILYLSLFLEITLFLPAYTGDIFINTLLGGVLMGIGVGLVVKNGASTGGSDFAALILKRFFPHISLANFILIIDGIIIIIAGTVFKSFTITAYSALALYISSKVTDYIIVLGDDAKVINVISHKNTEIAEVILRKFERGVTGIYCKGMYSGNDAVMMYCVVSPKELPLVISIIRKIDSDAFIVIYDAKEVLGEGFKTETPYDSIG